MRYDAEETSSPDPGDYAYWEKLGQRAREQLARLQEEEKPQTVAFELSLENRLVLQDALNEAKQHLGTNRNAKALAHICAEYLAHGPKARTLAKIEVKAEFRNKRLEEIMREMGAGATMLAFERAFPDHVLDQPK